MDSQTKQMNTHLDSHLTTQMDSQKSSDYSSQSRWILTLTSLILLMFTGCKSVDTQPEIRSSEYSDAKEFLAQADLIVTTHEKAVAQHRSDLKKAPPGSSERKIFQNRLFDAESRLHKAIQIQEYAKINLNTKKWAVRKEYLKSYNAGEPEWTPKTRDPAHIKSVSSLREAPANWSNKALLEAEKAKKQAASKPQAAAAH